MGKTLRDIMTIWEGVDYLFIDEITMVGCALLYEISSALKGSSLLVELTSYLLGTSHSYHLLDRTDSMHK
jgi:hypothetical protein